LIIDFIDHLFLEFQLDIYDQNGKWVAGNAMFYPAPLTLTQAIAKIKKQVGGYSALFTSPFPESRFANIVISWEPKERLILKKVIILLLASGLITVLVAFGVGWKLSSSLNKRLLILQQGVAEIKRGNFDIHLNIGGQDEIAQLGKNFNRMARQIRDLIQQLEESNKARRRLIAHASHEMKSPITSIKGFVDIVDYLKLLSDNPQGQQLLNTVRKDIQRVVKIADDLVQLAKYQEPGFLMEIKEIVLNNFLKEEHQYFENKARSQQSASTLEMPAEPPLIIRADPIRLAQIMDNLWNNALKYGKPAEPIVTRVSAAPPWVQVSISNALPFPLEVAPNQLFEPFYRHPKHAEKVKGSGLGLSIAKELVEKMGGVIYAEATEDRLTITTRWKLIHV